MCGGLVYSAARNFFFLSVKYFINYLGQRPSPGLGCGGVVATLRQGHRTGRRGRGTRAKAEQKEWAQTQEEGVFVHGGLLRLSAYHNYFILIIIREGDDGLKLFFVLLLSKKQII